MKKLSNIIIAVAVGLMLTGCGIYNKYEQKVETPDHAFGTTQDIKDAENGTSLGQMTWREMFTDPLLQKLIEQAIANNTDLNSARIAVEKSQTALTAAKLEYLPSLYLAPQGTLSKFDNNPWSKTYNLPLQMSMDIDVFGSITNKKRAAKAVMLQTQMQEKAIRANLVATTAQLYYTLQMLDQQLNILNMTDSLWKASLDTQKALWANGKAYSTAVNQMESSYLGVKTQIVDVHRDIRSTENLLCQLLGIVPQHIERQKWGYTDHHTVFKNIEESRIFDSKFLKVGVPASMLEQRPDICMANHAMEEAFYNIQGARSAFFPTITLSGEAGWTNNAGIAVLNPGKLLLNFVGQLTQPLFARGKIRANYKITKLTMEDLQKKYVQTVINAGNQVNEAMSGCKAAREKHNYYTRQVQVLYDAYIGTHELMNNGKAIYLEVLTAQESLLRSQLSEAANIYEGAEAVIALYIALGGGTM